MAEMYLEMIELFFIVGGILAIVIGALLFFKPDLVAKWSHLGNKWYSGSKWTKPLDVVHETDSFYFKNNLLIGVIMMIVSIIGFFLIAYRMPDMDQVLAATGNSEVGLSLAIFLEAMKWFLLVVIVLGLPMWGFLAFAPDKLKSINKKLNTWVNAGLILLPLEKMNHGFDNFVLHYHRFFGTLFVLGATFILFKFLG